MNINGENMKPISNLQKILASTALTLALSISMTTSVLSMEEEEISDAKRKILAVSPVYWQHTNTLEMKLEDEEVNERKKLQEKRKGELGGRVTAEYKRITDKDNLSYKKTREISEDEKPLMGTDEKNKIEMMNENGIGLEENLKEASALTYLKIEIKDRNELIEEALLLIESMKLKIEDAGDYGRVEVCKEALRNRYKELAPTEYLRTQLKDPEERKDLEDIRKVREKINKKINKKIDEEIKKIRNTRERERFKGKGKKLNRSIFFALPKRYRFLSQLGYNQLNQVMSSMKDEDGISVRRRLRKDAKVLRCVEEVKDRNMLLADAYLALMSIEGMLERQSLNYDDDRPLPPIPEPDDDDRPSPSTPGPDQPSGPIRAHRPLPQPPVPRQPSSPSNPQRRSLETLFRDQLTDKFENVTPPEEDDEVNSSDTWSFEN